MLQKSAHHYIPHPMEYSISTYFCAIWSTPECLDLYARWSSKMIKKSNSIRPKTFAKWSTPECQDLFARRSSQILIKQLHLSTYMCHLECSTLLLNRVLTPDGIFFLYLWSTPEGIFLSILPARGQDASTFGNCQKVSRPACLNLLDTARQLRQKPLAKKQV